MNRPWRPNERDARLQEARALRAQGHAQRALELLARLEVDHPRFSRLLQERGHCHVALGDAAAAVAALKQAVRLNPALPASWDMLAQLHRIRGEAEAAAVAFARLAALASLPVELVAAHSLYADGDRDPAEAGLRGYLAREPADVGALRLLARIRHDEGATGEAEAWLARALELAPDFHEARLDLALMLLDGGRHASARAEAARLLEADPHHRDALKAYAAACVGLGDYEAAATTYGRLLAQGAARGPETAELLCWRANAFKIIGRAEEAVADYRAALSAYPDYGLAWFGLANMKSHRFEDGEIARLRAAETRPGLQALDRTYLGFALGTAQESRGDHLLSWRAYESANALRRRSGDDDGEAAQACVRKVRAALTPEAFAERRGWGVANPAPIFIVGLPRSGSTLVEQILASHPEVEATHELAEIGRYAGELCGRDGPCGLPLRPEALLDLGADAAAALGVRYLQETRDYRQTRRAFFIDKQPNNFWHVGLIHLMLPCATIIDVRREPMACGFSNFKQLYGFANHAWSYSLEGIGRRYGTYLELMRHWDYALPGQVVRVHYEDLIDNLEGEVRRLLDRCGLPFDPACLAFHQTRRSVRTLSAEQVRRPLGRDGLDQWRRYAPWLHGLREALGNAITGYKD